MENIAIVDAGPLIALFDKSDKYYQKAKRRLEEYRQNDQGKLITAWPIVTEVSYILKERVHFQAQIDLLEWIILGGLEIFDLKKELLPRVIELQIKYSNLPMDFADATLIIIAEELNINKVFSIDKDFAIYRVSGRKHLENLMK
ncbi:MAG: PIN domain-containing protein [Elusimicrobia bacterium]|nr:PIN domain-containing protein [Elusimicrobiota bacterium]